MNRLLSYSFLSLGLFFCTGCAGICGQWESVGVEPADASKHFNLAKATFNCDGSFEATAEYDGKANTSKGTYKYDGHHLVLTTDGGEERKYEAKVCCDKLIVEHEMAEDKEVEVTMKKVGCAKDCKKENCCKKSVGGCSKPCDSEKKGEKT